MIDALLAYLAVHLGLSKAATVAILGLIVTVSKLVAKTIPDDATGALGVIRRVTKVIGLYVPNKKTA